MLGTLSGQNRPCRSNTRVQAKIELFESATSGSGSTAGSRATVVWARDLGKKKSRSNLIEFDLNLNIPGNLPGSFDESKNQLTWTLSFQSFYDSGEDDSVFVLLVLPRV